MSIKTQICASKRRSKMEYKYKWDINNCWFKEKCDLFNTEQCNSMCSRYRYLDFLAESALLTKSQQHPPRLSCGELDEEQFIELSEIKRDIENFIKSGNNLVIQSEFTGNGKTVLHAEKTVFVFLKNSEFIIHK